MWSIILLQLFIKNKNVLKNFKKKKRKFDLSIYYWIERKIKHS